MPQSRESLRQAAAESLAWADELSAERGDRESLLEVAHALRTYVAALLQLEEKVRAAAQRNWSLRDLGQVLGISAPAVAKRYSVEDPKAKQ